MTYDISWQQTIEMIRILKKQFRRRNAIENMLVKKFSFAPMETKILLYKSYCYPIYGCAFWRHSDQNPIRKLTVSYSDSFKRRINVPIDTPARVWHFAMNTTDHINGCSSNVLTAWWAEKQLPQTVYIVTVIVNSDAYMQSPLMNK